MALPLPIKFLALSALTLLVFDPKIDQARAEEPTSVPPPVAAEIPREPAAVNAKAQEDEYVEMMTPTKAELAEVVDSAAAATVKHAKKFKTVLDLVNEFKSRLNEENQKVLTDYLKDAKLDVPLKVSYANKMMTLRFNGGAVVAFTLADAENYKIKIDSSIVDISPTLPLNEVFKSIDTVLKNKFKSAGMLDLILPKSVAMGSLAVAGWILGGVSAAAAVGTIGVSWSVDEVNAEMLERNLKAINLATLTCHKFQDREVQTVYKTYKVKKKSKGRRAFRYIDFNVSKEVVLGPRATFERHLRLLIASQGERPSETSDNQAALEEWDKAYKVIKDKYDRDRLTRGHQPLTPEVSGLSHALRYTMCVGKKKHRMVNYNLSPKNWWVDEDDVDADEVLSFASLCTKAEQLESCMDELNRKSLLSDVGNHQLHRIFEKAKILKSALRRFDLPSTPERSNLVN